MVPFSKSKRKFRLKAFLPLGILIEPKHLEVPMQHFRAIAGWAWRASFLGIFLILTASAEDKYVKSEETVFPAVQADHALVYIARTEFKHLIPFPTFKVFVDGMPAGWLPQRSYLAVQVEPGRRLVWGPLENDPQRFDFKAGQTYLLLLVERYDPANNGVVRNTSWISADPADVKGLVADRKLSYVTSTEEAMAKLREEGAKEFQKQSKQAPDPAAASLPTTFETVWYRPGKRGFSFKAYEASGTLTVGKEIIEFKSNKKTLTIPVKDIQSVSYDKVTSAANFADPNLWGIVRFSTFGSLETAAFRDGHGLGNGGDSERIYLTLRSAAQAPPASSPMPRPSLPSAPAQESSPPSPAASEPPQPSPVAPQPVHAAGLPEGFVLYEGMKEQFTIALPQGWMAYDQSQALKEAPGRFGMVFFLASKDFTSETGVGPFISVGVMRKVDSGEFSSFFLQRQAADKGMSCTGFSEKAEKKLVDLIGKDPDFKKNALEPAHAEPATVGGCKGVRVHAKGQPQGGSSWVADAYMASDGETLYIFSLRNRAENYDKNVDVFQKAVSTAKFFAVER